MRRQKLWALILVLSLACSIAVPGASAECAEPAFDGYLVRLKEVQELQLFSMDEDIEPICEEIGLYHVQSLEDVKELEETGQMLYAEPNGYVTLFDTPNDPGYAQQWDLEAIDLSLARDWELDGTGVRVGIIDSGIDTDHEDLVGADIAGGYNYADDDTDISDNIGHGTFAAGILAAQSGNGVGIAGMADGVELVVLKAFNSNSGSFDSVLRAIKEAVDVYDCDVLNMSWGVYENYESLKAMIDYAADAGTVLVAAVGNRGTTTLCYPAGYDNVIGVGAVDSNKVRTSFSQYNASVSLVAPGKELYGLEENGGYTTGGGTSYACPQVTALAALLLQADQDLTAAEVTEILTSSAEDLGDAGRDNEYGYGFVTVPNMLKELMARNPLNVQPLETGYAVLGSSGLLKQPEAMVSVACFNQAGRFLQLFSLEHKLIMEETLVLPEDTAYGKILFTDESWCPLQQAYTWEIIAEIE